MKILIVEDEDVIREVEKAYLERAGYKCIEATDGRLALEKFKNDKFDLVILDINLPEINGIDVCKEIRKTSNVPVIMVTARTEEIDEIIGLEIGADDYIKKPFSPNIFVARVAAQLRKSGTETINIKDLEINPEKMVIKKGEESISLTTTQFNILYILASHPGKVYTRDEILDNAYEQSLPPDILDRTVDAHIKSIRKAIEKDPSRPEYILTVIGKGYKFYE